MVFTYCEKSNITSPFVREKVMDGRAWVEGLFRRNTMTAPCKAQILILEEPRNWTASLWMTALQN